MVQSGSAFLLGAAVLDWNDVRYFVAVARSGSTLTAARALRVSQPTVARRIDALERAIGVALFERLPGGYQATEAGRALLPAGEAIERSVARFEDAVAARARQVSGTVRLTTPQTIADLFVAPMLKSFGEHYPGVRVEVFADDRIFDLEAGEADVAIRAAPRPSEGALVCKLLATDRLLLCCSQDYADAHGVPRSADDLDGHAILLSGGPAAEAAITRWMREVAPRSAANYVTNTTAGGVANMRAGLGVGALPARLLPLYPDLVACFEAPAEVSLQTWLIAPERLRDEPRVRALLDFIGAFDARSPATSVAPTS